VQNASGINQNRLLPGYEQVWVVGEAGIQVGEANPVDAVVDLVGFVLVAEVPAFGPRVAAGRLYAAPPRLRA